MSGIGERLKGLLRDYRVTQKELSSHIEIPLRTIATIISGDSEPGIYKVQCIADYFNVSVDWLLTGKEPGSGQSQHINQRISGNHINTNQVVIGHGSRHIIIGDSGQGKDQVSVLTELFPKLSPGHQKTIIELVQLYSKDDSKSTNKE